MKVIRRLGALQAWRMRVGRNQTVGLVPTMGALHDGHLSLIRCSQKRDDLTVVSIFVNPIQFGPREDLGRYPRPWRSDVAFLRRAGVSILFAPAPAEMYPFGFSTIVSVPALSRTLCGAPRSRGQAHFDGVATVVAKLFHLVRPHRAYFGTKDFQQFRVIARMTADLDFGVDIVPCLTVREADGLAVSSRNAYLSPGQRWVAPGIYRSLQMGKKLLKSTQMSPAAICRRVSAALSAIPGCRIDYVDMVDPLTLQKLARRRVPALLAVAARFGKTRLIDNILIS